MRQYDIANGPGIRSTIFVTGCSRHCFNCFNPEYQDPKAGQEWTDKEMDQLLSWLSAPTNGGLTLLGGEPMENTAGLTQIVQKSNRHCPINQCGSIRDSPMTKSWRTRRKKPF